MIMTDEEGGINSEGRETIMTIEDQYKEAMTGVEEVVIVDGKTGRGTTTMEIETIATEEITLEQEAHPRKGPNLTGTWMLFFNCDWTK